MKSGGDLPIALFFPSDYSVGMSNLGYHYIYRSLRETGTRVERFFRSPVPYRSVEKDTMLERFPYIFAGVSYEGDIPAFAEWLSSGGIDPSRRSREDNCSQLICVGGAITYINPLSVSEIADIIVLGDALSVVPCIVEALRDNADRLELLEKLAVHPSIFVPAIHWDRMEGAELSLSKTKSLDDEYGCSTWITPKSVFEKTLLVELQRGCMRGCRYCTLPSCFKPFRQRGIEKVKQDISRIAALSDFDKVGLVTPEAGDYRHLNELLEFIGGLGKSVSFASLRIDGLTPEIVGALTRGGRHSITVAPESGDDELRASCGKKFTNDDILEALNMARERGVTSAKLYFMIGLPDESDTQVKSIASLCDRIKRETGLRLNATVSPFVPKPGTAWSGAAFAGESSLKKKYRVLSRAFDGDLKNSIQGASIKEACLEYALSWSTVEVSRIITEGSEWKNTLKKISSRTDRTSASAELSRLGLNTGLY